MTDALETEFALASAARRRTSAASSALSTIRSVSVTSGAVGPAARDSRWWA